MANNLDDLFDLIEMMCRTHLQPSLAVSHIKSELSRVTAERDKMRAERDRVIAIWPEKPQLGRDYSVDITGGMESSEWVRRQRDDTPVSTSE
jgi:hypothetical protein